MKYKLTIAIIVSLLLITGGILENIFIRNTFNEFSERLEKISEQEDYNLNDVYDTEKWLEKKHNRLEYFVPHYELNEVSVSYAEFVGSVEVGDSDTAAEQLKKLKQEVKRLDDVFQFKFQNII